MSMAVVGLLSAFVAGSLAMARDNDDKKSNRGSRSSSGSSHSGNRGSSARSFSSSPSKSSMQSRSASRSDSSRSFSGRSGNPFQIPSSNSASSARGARSFGSGASSKSFSNSRPGNTTFGGRSFSGRSSSSDSSSVRSFSGRIVARPVDNPSPNSSDNNKGARSPAFSRGNPPSGNSNFSGRQYFNTGSSNPALGNRFNNSSNDNSPNSSGSRQNRNPTTSGNGPNNGKNIFSNRQNDRFGNSQRANNVFGNGHGSNRFDQPSQNGNDGRSVGAQTSKEKIDAFLKLRQGGGNNFDNNNGRNFTGRTNRDGNDNKAGADIRNRFNNGRLGPQKSAADVKHDADQAWLKRFGKNDGASGNAPRFDNDGKSFPGKYGIHDGVVNLKGDHPGRIDPKKIDKAFVDRNYQDWRKGAFGNKKGRDADNRDWSGSWKNGDRFVAADQIRNHWKKGGDNWKNGKWNDKNMPFSKDWWHNHDHHDGHWNHWDHFGDRHYHPYHWWNWCSAPRLSTWITFGWGAPSYWDYGPGEYIYCNNGIVYVNGVWFEPAPVFYRRTLLLAQQAPVFTPVQAAQVQWLPLGVFAIARDGVADNNVLVQLAVTPDGVIGGTIFNQLTGATYPIQGMVDQTTQRAAWTYTDDFGAQIVMESSIFNLTQPAATGLIHYGPDNIQVMELVRLEDPSAGQ
jgi:hypothetical protein